MWGQVSWILILPFGNSPTNASGRKNKSRYCTRADAAAIKEVLIMQDMRGFYLWLAKEALGQPEGNPISDLALIVIRPDHRMAFTRARTLEQWQDLLPPEWRGEVNAIFRMYQDCPINEQDYLG